MFADMRQRFAEVGATLHRQFRQSAHTERTTPTIVQAVSAVRNGDMRLTSARRAWVLSRRNIGYVLVESQISQHIDLTIFFTI